MTREEVKKHLNILLANRCWHCRYERAENKVCDERCMFKQAINEATKALTADAEWIPCSERLPKKGEVVLITNGKGNVRCGQYRSEHDVRGDTHYWWWKGKTVESVLAWMPLPEPYKGGDTE